jgi:uncharacterized repeat protein (TIGR03803 family)
MRDLSWRKRTAAVFVFCAACVIAAPAQTFKSLSFDVADGAAPSGLLVQGFDGNLYGVAAAGGANGFGSVFKVTLGGIRTLYSFCSQPNCTDGQYPDAGLILGADGNFYGTTGWGGANMCGPNLGCGTIFKITPAGKLTTLYSFCSQPDCADGTNPEAVLLQGIDESLYGTTVAGGANGFGTVFKLTPSGLTTIYSFCSQPNCADGQSSEGGLILATDGNFYGTAARGGANGGGTIFRLTEGGSFSTLYTFCSQPGCLDGVAPYGGLIQATDGNLYGTTAGGANCNLLYGCGTIFKITLAGTLTSLYNFCQQPGCLDGGSPFAGLFQATDGNLYGTTSDGGLNDGGTIFDTTSDGMLTTLYSFYDGNPMAGVIQGTNGNIFGTTTRDGSYGVGTVYSLLGLRPFVETLGTFGKVGSKVFILGSDLTGTSSVVFNGTAATFTTVSKTEIKTTVPAGATTGYVTVTTPSGTLTSNVPFHVVK